MAIGGPPVGADRVDDNGLRFVDDAFHHPVVGLRPVPLGVEVDGVREQSDGVDCRGLSEADVREAGMPLFAQIPVDGLTDAPKGVLHDATVTPGERRGVHVVGGDVDCRVEILFIGRFRRIGECRDHTVADGFRKQVVGDMGGEVVVDDVAADPLGQGCGEACVLPGVVLGDSGELLVALFRVGDDAADDFIDADFGEGDTGVVPGVVGCGGGYAPRGGRVVLAVGVLEEAGAPGEVAA